MNTRREESKLQSRRRRARSSAEAGKDTKDTQRIVPRGPSGHEGRLKKVDEEEAKRAGAAKIDDPDLRGAPIDAPPAEEIEASIELARDVQRQHRQRGLAGPAADD